jgi:hypothetical protein
MPSLTIVSDGGDGPGAVDTYWGTSGTVTADASVSHTGPRSYKFDSAAGAVTRISRSGVLADNGIRGSVWVRFDNLPGSTVEVIQCLTSGGTAIWSIRLQSDGKLLLVAGGSTTGTTVLSTGAWYRIGWANTITSTTVHSERVWIQPSGGTAALEFSKDNNGTLGATAQNQIRLGWVANPGASKICYFDDIAADFGTDLTDIGDVRVTAKLPAAAGANNDFNTLVGSGTNRWDRVSERPVSATNAISHTAATVVRENFTLQGASAGDVDISGKTVMGFIGWSYAKRGSGTPTGTYYLTVNAVDTAVTLTTTDAYYHSAITTTATYPSGNQGIGMVSDGSVSVTMEECGVLVAYLQSAAAPALFAGSLGLMGVGI